jgi:hypothetical protein
VILHLCEIASYSGVSYIDFPVDDLRRCLFLRKTVLSSNDAQDPVPLSSVKASELIAPIVVIVISGPILVA